MAEASGNQADSGAAGQPGDTDPKGSSIIDPSPSAPRARDGRVRPPRTRGDPYMTCPGWPKGAVNACANGPKPPPAWNELQGDCPNPCGVCCAIAGICCAMAWIVCCSCWS